MALEVTEFSLQNSALANRYNSLFQSCPDAFIQQSLDWCKAILKIDNSTEPIFLLCSENGKDLAGFPLYLYRHSLGNVLSSIPHAGPMGGIFIKEGASQSQKELVYSALLEKAVDLAKKHSCLSLSIISNPFSDDVELYKRFLKPDTMLENFTQYIALNDPPHWSHGHRNNVNRAKAAGVTLKDCDSKKELLAWYEIHRKRHAEIGAPELSYQLIENIFDQLVPAGIARLVLAVHGERIVAGVLYILHKKVIDVFMISIDSEFADLYSSFLITEHSLEWSQKKGCLVYNWQSSPDKRSGVYQFKQQWGSRDATYYYISKFFCEPKRLQAIGLNQIQKAYRGHFVAPFQAFRDDFQKQLYKKGEPG